MNSAHTFRLFISSTFSDFVAEREALQRRVFPELEKFCAERGARFQAIDLRWGITEEAQREHDTLRICLEEVRRCQKLSPRPNFAVLLGDRYGWEPVPARIPLSHWTQLLSAADPLGGALITEQYQLDENAIPPVYCLRKREGDWAQANQRETELLQALRHAARGFTGPERLPYFASATHQEIALGALAAQDDEGHPLHPEEHVSVYVRRIQGLPQDVSARAFIDWDAESNALVPGARERLSALETDLRATLPGTQLHSFQAQWNGDATDGSHIESFCEQFLANQKAIIESELQTRQKRGYMASREVQHRSFASDRARNFVGRMQALESIRAYLGETGAATPMVVHGSGGTGKSALLAKAYFQTLDSVGDEAIVVARFIGGVPGSESLVQLLTELTEDIVVAYGRPAPAPPQSQKAASEAFSAALQASVVERPLVLILDALDQLDAADGAVLLEWLPKELGSYTRVLVSTREGRVLLTAQSRYPERLLELSSMTAAEGGQMLDAWLADTHEAHYNAGIVPARGRTLTPPQRESILSGFALNGKPLWLKLAYEEARSWASQDAPVTLPPTVEMMVRDLITRRLTESENHPRAFATRALAYITAGRFGLAEEEMDYALATDPEVKAEFEAQNARTGQQWNTDTKRLPPILWSRLYFDLQPYLASVQVDGTIVYRWFHREFKEEIGKKYLSDAEQKGNTHGHLAETFCALAPYGDDLFRYTDVGGQQQPAAMRRVMEQPWQLARAGRGDEVTALLTDFGFCMGKCAANRVDDLTQDVLWLQSTGAGSTVAQDWIKFFRRQRHVLGRGDAKWPAHKILLQVAVEHADESQVTQAAEAWLKQEQCDWVWVRQLRRPKEIPYTQLAAVMEGHRASVNGAQLLADGRILSWSSDGTLRLWDGRTGEVLAVMVGHSDDVCDTNLLPDGRILSWSLDGTLRLWDSATGEALAVMEGHAEEVNGTRLLPDGRILSWSLDSTLRLWDGGTGEALAVMEGHTDFVGDAQLLPDGSILSWSLDGTLRLWESGTGEAFAVMEGHTDFVGDAQLLPDGSILSWSDDRTLRLWDSKTGEALAVMEGHVGEVKGTQLLPDGRILSWSSDGILRQWDSGTGEALAVMEGHAEEVNGTRLLPDGRILSWSLDGTLRLWDGGTGETTAVMEGHSASVNGAQLLADGRILSWSSDGTLRLWDGRTGEVLAVMVGHSDVVCDTNLLPDGRILSWSLDGTLRLWDGGTGETTAVMEGHTGQILGTRLLPSCRILSWSSDGTLRLWELVTSEALVVTEGHTGQIQRTRLLPDGRILSWSWDGTLRLWDSGTGEALEVMEGHTSVVEGTQLLPDGRVLSRSLDGTLRLWDSRVGEALAVMEGHTSRTEGTQLMPDGRILSWSWDNTLRLWDGKTGKALAVMEGHTFWVDGTQLLPDGRILSWGDRTLRLWDGETGEALAVMEGHVGGVEGTQLLPDGRILSWSSDSTMRLWDGGTGETLWVMEGHTGGVKGTQMLPDGRILSWSLDQTLRLWDGGTGEALAVMEGHTGYIQGTQLLPDGRILSWSSDSTLRLWDGARGEALAVMEGHSKSVRPALLPDGRILSWSSDGTLRLWDGGGALITVGAQPWIEDIKLPIDGSLDIGFAGALRVGGIWAQEGQNYIAIANRAAGWFARWHGDQPKLQDCSAKTWVSTSGRQMHFLVVMKGNQRLAA